MRDAGKVQLRYQAEQYVRCMDKNAVLVPGIGYAKGLYRLYQDHARSQVCSAKTMTVPLQRCIQGPSATMRY